MSKKAIEKALIFVANLGRAFDAKKFDYSNSNKSYFVLFRAKSVNDFLDNSYPAVYDAKFVTRKELEKLVYAGNESPGAFKSIMKIESILDVKKNKVVKAKICTQIKLQYEPQNIR